MVRGALFLPTITPTWVGVRFVLDTGADTTALFPRDARSVLGIDRDAFDNAAGWSRPRLVGMAAGQAQSYPLPASYALRHEDGRWETIDGRVDLVRPSADTMPMESLLGWDVLRQFRLTIDWSQRLIGLERPGTTGR